MFTSKKFELTVITPVYNRQDLLHRMLVNFTNLDYSDYRVQWLIVDDGSDQDVLVDLDIPNNLTIEIIRQKNSGKHVAINSALIRAKGSFTIIVDSDDFINQAQFDNILSTISNYGNDYSGFIGYNEDLNGLKLGNLIDTKKVLRKDDIFRIRGDYSRVVNTDVMKVTMFDVFSEEKFNTEINLWSKIHAKIDFKKIDKAFVTIEYQPDGLSSKYFDLLRSNPQGVISTVNNLNLLGYNFLISYKFISNHLSYLDKPYQSICNLYGLGYPKKAFLIILVILLRLVRGKI